MAEAEGVGGAAADDDVVLEGDLEEAAGLDELAGDAEVGGAGGRVAGRVVVDAEDSGGRFADGEVVDLAGVDEGAVDGAGSDLGAAEDAVAVVEADDPEFFDGEALGAGLHESVDGLGGEEDGGLADVLADDAGGDF